MATTKTAATTTSVEAPKEPDEPKENNWLVIEDGVVISCAKEAYGDIIIPDGIEAIGDNAFNGCPDIVTVKIPNSVTTIGKGAFGFCDKLESIDIPDSVEYVGDYAFAYSKKLNGCILARAGQRLDHECLSIV